MNTPSRLFLILALFVLARVDVAAAQTETSGAPFSLAISVPETTVQAGNNLKIEVTIKNISGHDQFCEIGNTIPFRLLAHDSAGGEVRLTSLGLRAYHFSGSSFARVLHPGESIHRERLLDEDFDLTKPGTYTVQAAQELSGTTAARSNIVTITIVP
jgi:hypothetical protein